MLHRLCTFAMNKWHKMKTDSQLSMQQQLSLEIAGDESMTRTDPFFNDLPDAPFVETATIRKVVRILEKQPSRIYVSGPGGSGKTSLVNALQRHWQKTKRVVFTVRTREVRTENELIDKFARYLRKNSEFSFDDMIIRSSSDSAFDGIFRQLANQKADLLLLIDGFDETQDAGALDRFTRSAANIKTVSIVATGRDEPLNRHRRIFDHLLTMESFSVDELSEFLSKQAPKVEVNSELAKKLKSLGGGSPLITTKLLSLLQSEELDDFVANLPSQPDLLVEALLSRLFSRFESDLIQQEFRELLTLLALLGSVSEHELSHHQLGLIRELQQMGMVTSRQGTVEFTHIILREHYHSGDAILPSNFNLESIVLGAEEAERDQRLNEVFHELPGSRDIIAGTKNIVVGDRGAGKSAYFSQLPSLHGKNSKITRIQHPSNLLQGLQANGTQLTTSEEFRAGWLTIVAIELARLVPETAPSQLKSTARQLARISDSRRPDKRSLLGFFTGLINSNLKISLGPVTIEPAVRLEGGGKSVDLNWFLQEIASLLTDEFGKIVIAIDRIDEVHKYDRARQEKAVQGLFLAENEIAPIKNISMVVFLRSDLYEIYDIQEKNKLVSRSLRLSWKRHELLDFLIARVVTTSSLPVLRTVLDSYPALSRDIALSVIFPHKIEGMAPDDWLWSSLANGNGDINPRQILLLLFLAKKYQSEVKISRNAIPIFGESALIAAMRELSELSYKEIRDDFRVAKTFLANCRAGRLEQFEISDIEGLFDKDDGTIGDQVHQLERLGFLERVLTQSEGDVLTQKFLVPKLYTLGWSVGSTH